MKREKIVELIVNESETNGDGIYFLDESQVEYLADEIVKLLDLHSVNKCTCGKCTGLPDLESYYED